MAMTLADLMRSGKTPEEINAILSGSTMGSGTLDPNFMAGEAPMPPQAQPMNSIMNTSSGREVPLLDAMGRPSQSQATGPALDYSSPIEMGGMGKGYRLKGDATRAFINGQVVSMGRDTGAERARMKEELAIAKARQELANGDIESQVKRAQLMELMGIDPAAAGAMPSGGQAPSSQELAGQVRDQMSQRYLQRQHGKAPAGYRRTQSGDLEPEPGGPNDEKGRIKREGADDVNASIAALRDAYSRLEKGGGITSTEAGPLDNAAAAISASGIGQGVGKMLGTKNQSARNDVAMMRPALLAAMMKATGMSAKQMDSNAELKLWLSTATDPTLDVESNRRALANIERKYLRSSGQGGAPAASDSTVAGGSQDAQALEWANANPSDPRAAKIKAKLGVR